MEPWIIGALVAAGTAVGSVVTAVVQAWRTSKTVPVEVAGTNAKIQVDLVGAAGAIIDQLREQAERDRENFERRIAALEGELVRWREQSEERDHELAQSRMHTARQDEKIARQDARIGALEAEVRRLGGDPNEIAPRRS